MSHSAASSNASKKASGRVKSGNAGKKEEKATNGHHHKDNKKNESSSSEDDDEPTRAPTQLKIEFVNSIMFRQWALAKKLCHFMLMYEPDNREAKQYAPLIDYMLAKEQGSSSDDDDDTSDDDDSSGSSDSSNSSSNEEEKPADTDEAQAPKPVNASSSNKCTYHK